MSLPDRARFVIIGAGVHGLSTAWHLGEGLRARGEDPGGEILVLDKTGIGAGASGIACGVVRNNYFQPAMRELMAHSVSVWESDPEAFSYHPVGYMQGMFDDWRARNISVVLHEKRGGYANNMASVRGLAGKARAAGAEIREGVRVTGVRLDASGGAVTAVETDQGTVACDHLVVAAGPWVRSVWQLLDLPETTDVLGRDGKVHERPMWTFWSLQEGTLDVDPSTFTDNHGGMPPVLHVDTDAPLFDESGALVTDRLWGIYYKPDFSFGGVQGGAMPFVVDRPADEVAVDPYGPASPDFVVGEDFARLWTAGLAHCHKRFEGKRHLFSTEPSGGIGCFTPDSFPVFDTFRGNAYVIADSNHGYKMIGVGALVARELLGEPQALLEPFRFSRYAAGRLHPVSNSPFPWS